MEQRSQRRILFCQRFSLLPAEQVSSMSALKARRLVVDFAPVNTLAETTHRGELYPLVARVRLPIP
jgi:hypothetical protein